jgi:hypothetical protein
MWVPKQLTDEQKRAPLKRFYGKTEIRASPLPSMQFGSSPSDYHIFGHIKDALSGRRFANNEEVKDAVHTWLTTT